MNKTDLFSIIKKVVCTALVAAMLLVFAIRACTFLVEMILKENAVSNVPEIQRNVNKFAA